MTIEDALRGFLDDVAAVERPRGMDSFAELRAVAAKWAKVMAEPEPGPEPEPEPTPEPPPTFGRKGWELTDDYVGVPVAYVLTPSGPVTARTAGQVIEGFDIQGGLTVTADNVTVRNCRIRGGGYQVVTAMGVRGLVVERCTIDGTGTLAGSHGLNGSATLRRCKVVNVENGVNCYDDLTMEECWVASLYAPGAPHYDAVQNDGADRMRLVGCRLECHRPDGEPYGQTAAVMVDNYFGPVTDVVIEGCLLSGGGYTVYLDGSFSASRTISNVRVVGNRIRKGYWGHSLRRGALSNTTWAGNVDADTSQPVP